METQKTSNREDNIVESNCVKILRPCPWFWTALSDPYQLALQCVPDQDSGQKTGILCQSRDLPPMEDSLASEFFPAPASTGDDKEGHAHDDIEKLAEPVKTVRPTSKEFKKTWGFRSTTIAKRETPGDVGAQDGRNAPVRRSARQIRRSGKVEEFISTTKRGRGGRRSAPVYLESSEPQAPMPTDADSEASFEGSAGARATEESAGTNQPPERQMPPSVSAGDGASSNDSDELTLKELQELLKKRRNRDLIRLDQETDSLNKEDEENSLGELAEAEPVEGPACGSPAGGTSQYFISAHVSQKSTVGGKPILYSEEDEEEEELPGKSDNEGHDSNALYCICQQKHNNRFMICCDRCEEWFHGDCVGITEARGRLLERNGEDYVCPNCTARRTQPPATRGSEVGKQTEGSPSTAQMATSSDVEENHREDQWIKGRIERATIPSGKKKIKIFQLVMESSSLPKCIGPGCDKNALPDSVYCGTDCILKHAAATMKSLTTVKEPVLKAQAQRKLATKSIPKGRRRSLPGRTSMESCSSVVESSNSEEEAEVEQVPAAPFWSSDQNYDTVNPEKTTAIPSSVFYKSSVKESAESEDKKEPAHLEQQSPPTVTFPKGSKQNTIPRDPPNKRNKLVPVPLSWDGASKKSTLPPSRPTMYKKPSPASAVASQPVCPPASRHHVSGALRVSKTTYTIPRKLPLQPQLPLAPSSAAWLVSPAPVVASEPLRPQPNNQIRHNICRSLTEIMFKRVSDSDDLEMSEREVGKLAVHIEKEMYNLFFNTDNKYKNKYRTIMFNLKDPKNKGLFDQVVRGEVTPFKLVRLSPEELLSKDISTWMHRETTEVPEHSLKAQPRQLKLRLKQEASPSMDMDDSPPMSDGDACIFANSPLHDITSVPEQEEHGLASPLVKSCQPHLSSPVTNFFSKMLTDTTAEHRAHLFNLNCKICTGQMSADDEPVPKKPKNSGNKKSDAKARQVSRSSKVVDCPGEGSSAPPLTSEMFIMESPASPDDSSAVLLSQPITIPAVPSVTITGRDPRTAPRAITVTSATTTALSSTSESTPAIKAVLPSPLPPSIPKSILLKPTSSSDMPFFSASSSSMANSHSPPGGETALFLSKQEVVWKGFINMHNVAKFVTKAYLVSGSPEYLKEDLPDTIHIGGRISPETVWDYVAKLKTTPSKELCLIRFHPATEEEEVAYTSLFSYFNSRGRFGVVANNSRHIKDLYLIPLGAKASIPSKLVPFEGPGLEPNRPNLLLGLVICQKPKRSGTLQADAYKSAQRVLWKSKKPSTTQVKRAEGASTLPV
ncbi:hypothetical protein AAFF_G00240560 [Aldrovandia affinis]|uniref:Death-inducer obliterator 1 n=1 Tax=Aldrovandia affinis TaxID=143900 RepID=A0AAD7WU29_9TELE|nr:hypothetical protein AAFF_G00240560 [Aldrovandia affinis]